MSWFIRRFATIISFFSLAVLAHAQFARSVDPLLGAAGGGNVFPGPVIPFGMIKPGPDMENGAGRDANAGWNESGDIRGFSQTHVSGTGGGARYGNILVQPTTGPVTPLDMQSPRADEQASAGLYAVTLARYGVQVRITAARRSAIYELRYPNTETGAETGKKVPAEPIQDNLIFDVSHLLISGARQGENQSLVSCEIHILSPTAIAGSSAVKGGWNKQPVPYTVYFFARTDTPATAYGTWSSGNLSSGSRSAHGGADSKTGAWLTFAPRAGQPVRIKIGISFISVEQARRNLDAEILGFDLEAVRAAAIAKWNSALGKVELKGETSEQAQTFYTALYHTMLMPTDCTGENPLWKSAEPYYDDYYAIWDIFRSSGPLLTLIAPERETDIVRALVDLYRHEGWLPDARSGNYNGRTQGGSNAEFLLTDAYVKGLKGIDWQTALAAEIHDAEVAPADHFKEGRGGLDDWHHLGYVSIEGSDRPGSVDMEYAADDFEIALLAKGLHNAAAYSKYLARSANWTKLWDSGFTDGGFTGFIRPRHRDGSWLQPFTAMDSCTWGGKTFYEGNSWTYSFFVPQNEAALIQTMGGADTFVRRLDAFFAVPGRYDVGNEPGFLAPYLYLWAGRPDKTDAHVLTIIAQSFHAGRKGLPGNDDSGAMSSWYAFGEMGIFPNAGQDIYLIGSPAYPQTTLHLARGRQFVIEARNLSPGNIYVTAATLNGKPLDRAWLRHNEIVAGGRLVLTMAAAPGHWAEHNPPPSTAAP
ncbi:MAG TPA: GH92 family glycosyl hydrolase [Terracidiphilus sp.]|jgi:predicted alpha-1,2-mannosidase|nr:GH92 family glycosyl hydrolase [Terracidiphilus sp.]